MRYAQQMIEAKKTLEEMGHTVEVPHDIETHLKDPDLVDNLSANLKHAGELDLMRECFELVADADAIVVLNFDRNNTPGYIGTSTLMEIGLAYFLKKKIFLYNPIPSHHVARWAHEIQLINPTIIHGDLSKVI